MTFARFLLRSMIHHWRGNLAVTLGVGVGCAVLTGALFVGDSLRGSLRDRARLSNLDGLMCRWLQIGYSPKNWRTI